MSDQSQNQDKPAQTQGSEPPVAAPTKPEGLPDSFWDAGTSSVKMTDLVAAHTALSDATRLREEAAALIPKDHTGYEVALPEGYDVPEGFALMAEGDPRAEQIQKWAHENGLKPDAVKSLMGIYAQDQIEAIKASQAELASLGQNAKEQLADVRVALHGRLPAEQAQALAESLTSAKAVRGLQALLSNAKVTPPTNADARPKADP